MATQFSVLDWRIPLPVQSMESQIVRYDCKTFTFTLQVSLWGSLLAQMVKNVPAIQKTWIQSPSQEDPLEKGMATHSSILAWTTP